VNHNLFITYGIRPHCWLFLVLFILLIFEFGHYFQSTCPKQFMSTAPKFKLLLLLILSSLLLLVNGHQGSKFCPSLLNTTVQIFEFLLGIFGFSMFLCWLFCQLCRPMCALSANVGYCDVDVFRKHITNVITLYTSWLCP
jgi:hypothetical protein